MSGVVVVILSANDSLLKVSSTQQNVKRGTTDQTAGGITKQVEVEVEGSGAEAKQRARIGKQRDNHKKNLLSGQYIVGPPHFIHLLWDSGLAMPSA